jgi:peptide/nickel transport system substrate-binding protein
MASRSARENSTVVFLVEASPINLDPRIGTDAVSEHFHGLLFNSLIAHDAQMNIIPDLATSWDMPDPLTYVFHLRPGVKFHDGRALSSADVKFTFDSILAGDLKTPKRGAFQTLKSVEAPDPATVIFHLSEPYASFLWSIARPAIGIVPQGSGVEFAQHPIGTGPFQFVSMALDDEVVLDRNPDYFAGPPTIQRVRFRVVTDATVRALELRKGTADITAVNALAPDMAVTLAEQPGILKEDDPGTQLQYISMNFSDPILAHKEVRQALAYATDRPTLIKYLLRDQARIAHSLLPPNHWAYEPDVRRYDYDPAKANQLLDKAGFPRGKDGVRFHLEMKTSSEEPTRLRAEAITDEWKKIGVVLDLRPLEFATFLSDINHGSFQLYTFGWVGANNDPDIFQYVFSSKKFPPDGANRGHYKSAALDALLDRERVEMDRDKRKAILSQIQRMVAEDEPYINLWYQDNVVLHRDDLTGIVIPPAGDYDFLVRAQLNKP